MIINQKAVIKFAQAIVAFSRRFSSQITLQGVDECMPPRDHARPVRSGASRLILFDKSHLFCVRIFDWAVLSTADFHNEIVGQLVDQMEQSSVAIWLDFKSGE